MIVLLEAIFLEHLTVAWSQCRVRRPATADRIEFYCLSPGPGIQDLRNGRVATICIFERLNLLRQHAAVLVEQPIVLLVEPHGQVLQLVFGQLVGKISELNAPFIDFVFELPPEILWWLLLERETGLTELLIIKNEPLQVGLVPRVDTQLRDGRLLLADRDETEESRLLPRVEMDLLIQPVHARRINVRVLFRDLILSEFFDRCVSLKPQLLESFVLHTSVFDPVCLLIEDGESRVLGLVSQQEIRLNVQSKVLLEAGAMQNTVDADFLQWNIRLSV